MKAKANLKLRKVGDRYMLVDVSEKDANVTNVYTLNGTAAFVWTRLAAGISEAAELADELCSEYDVAPATALADVRKLLASWQESGLITELL